MGYTVMPASDQVGLGTTAIGDIDGAYVANDKKLAGYQRQIGASRFAVERGLRRSAEDELRRAVIHRIICTLKLEHDWVELHWGVDPRRHFRTELEALEPMAVDGLVEIDHQGLQVTTTGRFFLRNVCMPFDTYLREPEEGTGPVYSRTV
jgi:oxygen-independent coproporphyrinogen-3 oxidase